MVFPEPVSDNTIRSWSSWPAVRAAVCSSLRSSIRRWESMAFMVPGVINMARKYASSATWPLQVVFAGIRKR